MKILYINVINQHSGWGAEYFLNRALIKNGHTTFNIDYRKHRKYLYKQIRHIKYFDCLLLQRGDFFPIELLKACKKPMFFWASELVSRRRDQDRLFKSGLFKKVFVRSQDCKDIIIKNKWLREDQIDIFLSAYDEHIHKKYGNNNKDIDVLFIGSISKRRRRILDDLKKDFKVVELRAYGKEMSKLFSRAKIVLNIHYENYLDVETRIFEVLGSGTFCITERLSNDNPFINGLHLVEVDSINELKEKISYYLSNNVDREAIAKRGYVEASKKHTYHFRSLQISNIMKNYCIQSSGDESPFENNLLERYRRLEPLVYRKLLFERYFNKIHSSIIPRRRIIDGR